MSEAKVVATKSKEIKLKREEIAQAIQHVADIHLQWGKNKEIPKFTYKNEEYTPEKIKYIVAHVGELVNEYANLLAPERTNSLTTKTAQIAPELVAFFKDTNTNIGSVVVNGETKLARPLLLSLVKGRSCHRVVSNAIMRYVSVNGLNKNDPKPGFRAPNMRSTTDENMKKYIGKHIDAAGETYVAKGGKMFSAETGFAGFNASSIASALFVDDKEYSPEQGELDTYRNRLEELKSEDGSYPLSSYIDALAAVTNPSEALVDYANCRNDIAVIKLAKEFSEKEKNAAKVVTTAKEGGRGRGRGKSPQTETVPTDNTPAANTSTSVTTIPAAEPAAVADAVVQTQEPPQESQNSVKDVVVPATPAKTVPTKAAAKIATPKVPATAKVTKTPAKPSTRVTKQ